MNKSIRLRAFNKKTKTFGYMTLENMTSTTKMKMYTKEGGVSFVFHDCEEWDRFTGKKDSKGVEIWEGDIIGQDEEDDESVGWVSWSDKDAAFVVNYLLEDDLGRRIATTPLRDYVYPGDKYSKIIGNLYENPELVHQIP